MNAKTAELLPKKTLSLQLLPNRIFLLLLFGSSLDQLVHPVGAQLLTDSVTVGGSDRDFCRIYLF